MQLKTEEELRNLMYSIQDRIDELRNQSRRINGREEFADQSIYISRLIEKLTSDYFKMNDMISELRSAKYLTKVFNHFS